MDLTKLTVDDIKVAFRNSGFDEPDIEETHWAGEVSRGAHIYSMTFAPLPIPHECLSSHCAWVYIKEVEGKLYADL